MHFRIAHAISTHTPLAGRDQDLYRYATHYWISTHTPLAGRDKVGRNRTAHPRLFLLTRPLRDVTASSSRSVPHGKISTHTPLAGRDEFYEKVVYDMEISTHTPLAGRDVIL